MATKWAPKAGSTPPKASDFEGMKGGGNTTPSTLPPDVPTGPGLGSSENPIWYTPTNVYRPPGVDPYYGVSIVPIGGGLTSGSSGSTGTTPEPTTGTGGGKTGGGARDLGDITPFNPKDDPGYMSYLNNWGVYDYYGDGSVPKGAMTYPQWKALNGTTNNSNSGSGTNTGGGGFKIARPNMTWENSLPSVIPSNGQEALNAYAPIPFTREANTPGASYSKPPLTYNNPYNTNPYLPTANPFALIANQSQAS